jgi:hypothetical protein
MSLDTISNIFKDSSVDLTLFTDMYIILLGEVPSDEIDDLFKLDTYTQMSAYELPNENGYVTGGKTLTNITKVPDLNENIVTINADDVTWYTTPLDPINFEVYGYSIVDVNNNVIMTSYFDNRRITENSDFVIKWSENVSTPNAVFKF